MPGKYTTYAIQSIERNYLYVGMTNDLERRFDEHQTGKNKTTKPYRPFRITYTKEFDTRMDAREHEKMLKSGFGKESLKGLEK